MRLIPIEYAKRNMVLGKTIYDTDGRVLLRSGVVLSNPTIDKIKELNILTIYIVDKYSDETIEDIIKPEIRQKTVITIKEAFSNIGRLKSNSKSLDGGHTKQEEGYFNNIGDMVDSLVENVLDNRDVLLSLVDIRSINNYIYAHCVNVAVISMVLGIALKLPKKKLVALCTGALIHDIGKSFVPNNILTKTTDLTLGEQVVLKQHSRIGYKYLSDVYNLSATSKLIVLQHHERVDGTGYPDGLEADKILDLSKIVAIADAYDIMSTGTYNKRAMFPSDVLEFLMSNAGKMFDYEMVNIFCRIVIPFAKGTIVNLSNGDIAIVEETVPNYPLRPIVRVIESPRVSRIGDVVNLIKELSIVITSIRYEM